MGFKARRFGKAKFEHRTEAVAVPDLAQWFDEGEAPEWIVRGLTHAEIAKANEAVNSNKAIAETVAKLVGGNAKEKAEAVQAIFQVDDTTPDDTVRRIAQLVAGSVSPEVDQPTAVKFAEVYPVEFMVLTNKIMELSGQGQVLVEGKPAPSGEKTASE